MLRRIKRFIPKPVFGLYHWLRAVLAVLAYGYPARHLNVIGITGTDGKTTTAHLLYSILRQAKRRASLISTTGAVIYGRENVPLGLHVTTPNPFELQRFLKTARQTGSDTIVLEATSHGLAQHRVMGSNFRIGVVTNITDEHLDYHGSYDQYLADKARLFRRVRTSILNLDDRSYPRLREMASGKQVTYGLDPAAQITATEIRHTPGGSTLMVPAIDRRVRTRFAGDYNVQNILAAVAVALALRIDPGHIAAGLEAAVPPPGRLEKIERGQPFSVYVDFAHTAHGLDSLLKMLHGVKEKRLIVVFGCAGERDPFKRFPMGASAGKYADLTVITAEDPRTEDLDAIIDQVADGVESEGGVFGESYFRVPDRSEAIAFAIQKLAQPGDIVVTTGKAHERSMCFGTVEHPWDEFAAVEAALAGLSQAEPAAQQP